MSDSWLSALPTFFLKKVPLPHKKIKKFPNKQTSKNYLLILTSFSRAVAREAQSASTSSLVLYSEKLIRNEQSASAGVSPNAISVPLGVFECEEHAEPLEINIPSAERKCNTVSLFIFGTVTLIMWCAKAP